MAKNRQSKKIKTSRKKMGCLTLSRIACVLVHVLQMIGTRLREAINMQWDYLNLANGQIHLPDSKTVRKTLFLINKVK